MLYFKAQILKAIYLGRTNSLFLCPSRLCLIQGQESLARAFKEMPLAEFVPKFIWQHFCMLAGSEWQAALWEQPAKEFSL